MQISKDQQGKTTMLNGTSSSTSQKGPHEGFTGNALAQVKRIQTPLTAYKSIIKNKQEKQLFDQEGVNNR